MATDQTKTGGIKDMETSEQQERPLITFLLICYNQEQYIKEALEGAFSQTYSPLEIVISDDCSTDRTWEIVQQEVENYQGPHKIKLNRNEENRGLVGNFNRAVELSSGEIIVAAAGDDISVSERVYVVHKKIKEMGEDCVAVYSGGKLIDKNGCEIGGFKPPVDNLGDVYEFLLGVGKISGASHAFKKIVYDVFGGLDERLIGEDRCMAFRELLIGKIEYINQDLIYYRKGVGVSSSYISQPKWHIDRLVSQHKSDEGVVSDRLKIDNKYYLVYKGKEYYISEIADGNNSILRVFFYKRKYNIGLIWLLKMYFSSKFPSVYMVYISVVRK